jgi:hypothetical protein
VDVAVDVAVVVALHLTYDCFCIGTTMNCTLYTMQWTNCHVHIHIHNVDRLAVVSNFFGQSNKVDSHNQLRKSVMGLEKCWLTQDFLFCLHTTMAGIHVTGVFRFCMHHGLSHASTTIS